MELAGSDGEFICEIDDELTEDFKDEANAPEGTEAIEAVNDVLMMEALSSLEAKNTEWTEKKRYWTSMVPTKNLYDSISMGEEVNHISEKHETAVEELDIVALDTYSPRSLQHAIVEARQAIQAVEFAGEFVTGIRELLLLVDEWTTSGPLPLVHGRRAFSLPVNADDSTVLLRQLVKALRKQLSLAMSEQWKETLSKELRWRVINAHLTLQQQVLPMANYMLQTTYGMPSRRI